ncbi:cytoplasmic tRNA adenylyltransferase 1, partial [Haematococcus lacustris]
LTHPLRLRQLVKDTGEPSVEVLAAAELNLCVHNKAGLVLDKGMYLSNATVNLLTEQYLSHSHRTAQQPTHPTVASSSHSGPSTSLASSSISAGQRAQKEIVMYAYFKRLDYFSTECVYAPFAARGFARDFIKDLEQ